MKKPAGRPLKPAIAGQRAPLGLKVTPEIKQRLDQVAKANGRTQSQEAEARLERSFREEDLLAEIREMVRTELCQTIAELLKHPRVVTILRQVA